MSIIKVKGIKAVALNAKKAFAKNAPQILAGLGIAFGAGATVTAVRGTIKAVHIVQEKETERGERLTKQEIVKSVWLEYAPTVLLTGMSAACIVGSVKVSMRRLATLGVAYAMSEKSFDEYKDKVRKVLGESKEEEVRGALGQDYIDANPPTMETIERGRGGTTLCLDRLSGRYFYSDADTIKRVILELNRDLLTSTTVSLNDFYYSMNLRESEFGGMFHWELDENNYISGTTASLIEPVFTTELTDDNVPVLVLDFTRNPRAVTFD